MLRPINTSAGPMVRFFVCPSITHIFVPLANQHQIQGQYQPEHPAALARSIKERAKARSRIK
jgi:hypothetical protein